MCGRYASFLPAEALRRTFRTVNPLPNLEPSWNIAPTQMAPVVRRHPETGERHLDLMEWGLLRWWQRDLKPSRPIHVRAETLVQKRGPLARAFVHRRALAPADALYEWKTAEHDKQPGALVRSDGQPMGFAALWEECRLTNWRLVLSFAIATTVANSDIAGLHDRMPVILEPADWPLWLGEVPGDPASLLHPSPAGTLRVWPMDRPGNIPRNDGPELLQPVEAATR
jgi:putative SOS response-associated peptidase YedK